ncbi:MAG TPA: PsiF family protein [Nevskiaceae bacterium]|nr:PsiF family protein [Nevskiaceae bacterium]
MKKLLIGVALSLFVASSAWAASPAQLASQQRMKECAPLTKGMTKTERSEFMHKCLSKSGHEAAMASKGKMAKVEHKAKTSSKRAAQREKMKVCNADAKTKKLKGAERKAFMKTCLTKG